MNVFVICYDDRHCGLNTLGVYKDQNTMKEKFKHHILMTCDQVTPDNLDKVIGEFIKDKYVNVKDCVCQSNNI